MDPGRWISNAKTRGVWLLLMATFVGLLSTVLVLLLKNRWSRRRPAVVEESTPRRVAVTRPRVRYPTAGATSTDAGSVSGTVRWNDGSPASGVDVSVSPAGLDTTVVKTAHDGTYALEGIPGGRVRVAVSGSAEPVPVRKDQGPGWRMVDLAPGQQRTGIDFVVSRPADRISGLVIGPDGGPLGGVVVGVKAETEGTEHRIPVCGGLTGAQTKTRSQSDGTFEIDGLAPGSYTVAAEDAAGRSFGLIKRVGVGQSGVRLALKRSPTLSGTVADQDGNPVPGFYFRVRRSPSPGEQPGFCLRYGKDGASTVFSGGTAGFRSEASDFDLWGLGSGTFDLSVIAVDGRRGELREVALKEGEDRRGLRIVVAGSAEEADQETVTVKGLVIDGASREPLTDVGIHCMGEACPAARSGEAHGEFTLVGFIPGGRATLVFRHRATASTGRTDVVVPRGATELDLGTIELKRR